MSSPYNILKRNWYDARLPFALYISEICFARILLSAMTESSIIGMKSSLKKDKKSPVVLSTSAYESRLLPAINELPVKELTFAVYPLFCPTISSSIKK